MAGLFVFDDAVGFSDGRRPLTRILALRRLRSAPFIRVIGGDRLSLRPLDLVRRVVGGYAKELIGGEGFKIVHKPTSFD